MKIVASGHEGVDQFLAQEAPKTVIQVRSWSEAVQAMDKAEAVLVGERIPDFDMALEWLLDRPHRAGGPEVVIWVGEKFSHSRWEELQGRAEVWRGEIDADRLRRWWASSDLTSLVLPQRFTVVSVFPYPPLKPLVECLGALARKQWGPGGGWVDLDEAGAGASLYVAPRVFERGEYLFERWRALAVDGLWVIPAPPPWRPGSAVPENADLDRMLNLPWAWQGLYLGSRIGRREALYVVSRVEHMMVWASQDTSERVLQNTREFCRLYQPQLHVSVLSPDTLRASPAEPECDSGRPRLGVRAWMAHARAKTKGKGFDVNV
ncbi:hypothetical protein [Sulfobacillus harzensis]|uniref:Uncharacterized protein n=1 Tax=Sulfobacillus harzensis TaxID=2729629 RepID=A0A7Y0L618_9FIRM|nr:hypothetical protein [Sulfobacillus harzensis]NMP22569.1 hypothetical protein [Sulfobacillus harzensis]